MTKEQLGNIVKNISLLFLSILALIHAYHLYNLTDYRHCGLMLILSIIALFIKEIDFEEEQINDM
uniref:Uncharacterized protein n=1 Tax=viral metagenome TaxID=1070528 RepID=A0A6M3X6X0_9ZZZZ